MGNFAWARRCVHGPAEIHAGDSSERQRMSEGVAAINGRQKAYLTPRQTCSGPEQNKEPPAGSSALVPVLGRNTTDIY